MNPFLDSFSNGEITLISSVLSAGIAGVVSILTTRYVIKHGPNYEEQIEGLHETIGSLAKTQEELRKQQAEQARVETERYEHGLRKAEAARWKPQAGIDSRSDAERQVNELRIASHEAFRLLNVSLVDRHGAKVHSYPIDTENHSTEFSITVDHPSLCKISNADPDYPRTSAFIAKLQYTVEREGESSATFELPFRASLVFVSHTAFFKLTG